MFDGEQAPCLLFVATDGKPGSPRKSGCTSADSLAKGYALFPQFFRDRHPEVVEIFCQNNVRVMSTAPDDSSLPMASSSLTFEMFEMQVILKSPESEDFSSHAPSSLLILADLFNREVVELLFRKNVHYFDLSILNEDRTGYLDMDGGNYLKVVENLLSCDKTIGYRHSRGGTILHFAVREGMKNLVKLLLQFKADVDAKQHDGMTPLHVAVNEWEEEIVGVLLEHGADVNSRGYDGLTPLHIAATDGHVGIVKSLLRHGADVNARVEIEDQRGWTSLVFAHHNLHREVAELLLKFGADVNIVFDHRAKVNSTHYLSSSDEQVKSVTKATILYTAALTKDSEFIKLILRQQPDVANEYNRRAFHFVLFELEYDFDVIFEQMKQYGFTIDYDHFHNSVKFLCGAIDKNCFEVVQKMVEEGVNVNEVYESQLFGKLLPLHIAARHSEVNIIKLLIDHGADVNAELNERFPIHCAIQSNNINAVKYFVTNKINFPDKADVLHVAAEAGSPEMIEYLLLNGYPMPSKNEYSKAVSLAASTRCTETLELLYKYGAELGSERVNYWRPLQTALGEGCPEIFQTIIEQCFTNLQFISYIEIFHRCERYIFRDGNSCTYSELYSKILAEQILKLEAASLCAFNQDIASFWHASESIDDFRNRCKIEVAQLKSERVGDSQVVFFDFLTQSVSRLVGFARNDSIIEAMKDDNCCGKFPIYSRLLNRQFKKGLQRKELMQQGIKTCNALFAGKIFQDLPYELKVKIINYLSNCDLLVLNNILPTATRSEGQ